MERSAESAEALEKEYGVKAISLRQM